MFLLNIEKLFIFYKFDSLFKFCNTNNFFNSNNIIFFFKHLFMYKTIKSIFNSNLIFIFNYYNNLIQSALYYIFKNFNLFLINNEKIIKILKFDNIFTYNLYFCSIKIINFRINKKFFQYMFFFLFFFNLEPLISYSNLFKFKKNFIFIFSNFQLYYNYNTYFLNIYNY